MYKNSKINLLQKYLIYFIPLALLTGPFLPDFFVTIITFSFIYVIIKERKYKYLNNIFFKFFLIFYIYLLINSFISENSLFSLKSSAVYLRFGIFSLAVWYIIDTNKDFIKIFNNFLIGAFIAAIIIGFYQYIFGETIFGTPTPNNRLLLLTSDGLLLGQYLSRLFPLILAMMIYNYRSNYKYYFLLFILFILTDAIIYISGERTALGLLVISSFFILIMIKKLKLFRVMTIFCSIALIFLISFLNPEIKERNIDYTLEQIGLNKDSEKINLISSVHESHYITAWKMFLENPITGVGPNNFRKFCDQKEFYYSINSCSTHPHSTYLQILSELGIVGISTFLFINCYLFIVCFRHIYSIVKSRKRYFDDYQICLIACFLCTLWPFFPSLNFFNNWINIVYYLPVGFFLYSIYEKKHE